MCRAARAPVIYHDRPSPRLVVCGWTPFPTLSISDAERRAYHNRRVSDARYPQRIFDTLWILVRSAPMVGRSKPRPYSAYIQHNTRRRHHSVVVADRCDRVGAWELLCNLCRVEDTAEVYDRRRRSGYGKPHVQPRRGLT